MSHVSLPRKSAIVFDQILSWMLIVIPVAFGLILIFVPGRHEDERRHMRWRYVLGVLLILFGILTWIQQSRAIKASMRERDDAIQQTSARVASETSAKVTKAVSDQYQAMVSDLVGQVQNLKQKLSEQAKDVGIIKSSNIVTGKNPIKVEVTNEPIGVNRETEAERKRRIIIRTNLGLLLNEARTIMNACLVQPPISASSCENSANQWNTKAVKYIQGNIEPSYLSRFNSATGITFGWPTADEKIDKIVNILNFRAAALEQFIKEQF